jgi:hypothetical protein
MLWHAFGRLSFVALFLCGLSAGCRPKLEPDEDAVLSYLRNARVGGEVRRVWPEGQRYIDSLLAVDAKLLKAIGQLEPFGLAESLWHRDDPRWRDEKLLAGRIEKLVELLREEKSETKENKDPAHEKKPPGKADRAELLAQWSKAIGEAPAGLSDPATTARVEEALALEGMYRGMSIREAISTLEAFAGAHLALLQAVAAVGDGFDPDGEGLALAEGTDGAEIDRMYRDLSARLSQRLDAFIQYGEAQLLGAQRVEGAERGIREYHGARRAFFRKQLESLAKQYQIREDRLVEKQEDKGLPPAEREFLIRQADEIKAMRTSIKQRVDAILNPAKAATTAAGERD